MLVESKSSARGSAADRILRELGVRPASVSKYCVGVAALHPELPSNPWHQTLRRYFEPLRGRRLTVTRAEERSMTGALSAGEHCTVVALSTAAVLAGCWRPAPLPPHPPPARRRRPEHRRRRRRPRRPPPSGDLVMVIRHGEKPDDTPHPASTRRERGRQLADRGRLGPGAPAGRPLRPGPGSPRPGLARPTAIYAAGANDDGEGARTRETVTPLADRLGITVDTSFGKGDEEELVEHVIAHPGPTLISLAARRDPGHRRGLPAR